MKSIGLSEKVIKQLQSVFEKNSKVLAVTLYGSRAKGTFKNGSDIDLAIEGPELSLSELFRIENEIEDLALPYQVDLSLIHRIENEELLEHVRRLGVSFYRKR